MEASITHASLKVQEVAPVEDKLPIEETAITEAPTPKQLEVKT